MVSIILAGNGTYIIGGDNNRTITVKDNEIVRYTASKNDLIGFIQYYLYTQLCMGKDNYIKAPVLRRASYYDLERINQGYRFKINIPIFIKFRQLYCIILSNNAMLKYELPYNDCGLKAFKHPKIYNGNKKDFIKLFSILTEQFLNYSLMYIGNPDINLYYNKENLKVIDAFTELGFKQEATYKNKNYNQPRVVLIKHLE